MAQKYKGNAVNAAKILQRYSFDASRARELYFGRQFHYEIDSGIP